MRTKRTPFIMAMTSSFVLAGFFCSTSLAETLSAAHVSGADSKMPLSETDSKGSFSFEEDNQEGSKSESLPQGTDEKKEGSGSKAYPKKDHGKAYGKKEGSGSKNYAPSKHGYMHKKEGSGGQKYSHGSPHERPHGYSSEGQGDSGHRGSHGKNPFKHVLCFKEKLGLTDEQVEQIKSREFEYNKFKVQSKADHAIAHMELDRLVHAETIDEAGIRALADRISQIKSGTIHATIEAKIAVLKILTPEQRKKVHEKHSAH